MRKSVKINYLLNLGYQLLLIALPLITTPYISRVLGDYAIGSYSFTQSVVTYFTLLGCIGLGLYGQREIAYCQNDFQKRTKLLYELVLLKLISVTVSFVLYFFVIQSVEKFQLLFYIQMIDLIANIFDINYFYQGLEDFSKIITRNVIVRFISIACVFLLVKSPEDLPLYVLIQSLSILFGNMSMWLTLPKYLVRLDQYSLEIKKHLRPTLVLFLPQVAVSVYTVLDRTMIELLTGNTREIGYYEQAQKIVKLALTIVTSLGTVMLPRISSLYAGEQNEAIKRYIYQSLQFVMLIGCPIMFGLIGVAHNLVPWFLGDQFLASIPLVMITAPIVIFIGMSNVIGIQFLLPTRRQKAYTVSTLVGSGVNLALNLVLIPRFLSLGATIASVIAELSVTVFQFYCVHDVIRLRPIIKENSKYLFMSLAMFAIVYPMSIWLKPSVLYTVLLMGIGASFYFIGLILVKDSLIYGIIDTIKQKSKKLKG